MRAATDDEAARALGRAVRALVSHQGPDGQWEGETVWCVMLPAQYVLMCHVTGLEIPAPRRARLLRQLRVTRGADGLWGLHEHSRGYLFTTALAYVAARLLGVPATDPMLADARDLFERERGVAAIPSWGKFWLAMVGLYEWEGVNPILPEVWVLPERFPLHPANYYCHTRLIYMGMAACYARKVRAPRTPIVDALRRELYPDGYRRVDWTRARRSLHEGDIYTWPGRRLRAMFEACRLYERVHSRRLRARMLARIDERIRFELRSTDYTCLSPVNGLLFQIALWHDDPEDPDLRRARERFEGWIWEDDAEGMRVAGARSATWDSAFAVQALSAAARAGAVDVAEPLARGLSFLSSQQIAESFPGWKRAYRVDPKGGFCFAGVWHGWPVSDCTAEALEAFLAAPGHAPDRGRVEDGIGFLLQCQNPDGGFGSYEARKTRVGLEWMNPAEMFGDSMTELSYYECTASNLSALAAFVARYPDSALAPRAERAMARAHRYLAEAQNEDGTWDGAWGVWFTYGTMFGVRGLLAGGTPKSDPAIRRACRWLLDHQRADGGWGEDSSISESNAYREAPSSHAVQTAWAMLTLLEAGEPDLEAIARGARYLASVQGPDGEFPHQGMVGVFFHTALLDYRMYRRIFPAWALARFEERRREQSARESHSPRNDHDDHRTDPSPARA